MTVKPSYEELEAQIRDLEQEKSRYEQLKDKISCREAFLETLIEAIPIPIFYKDLDGRYVGFNSAFESFFGETRDHLIGKTVFDINPPELARIYHARDNELLRSGDIQNYESQVRNKHGQLSNVIFHKAVYPDKEGAVAGMVGAVLDVTKRKQAEEALRESEERYRRVFDNSLVGFFQSTPEGQFIKVNTAFAKMLKYDSPEDLISSITDIAVQYYVNPEDRRRYQRILGLHGYVENFEFRVLQKGGSQIWVSNSTRAYLDDTGKILYYEGVVIDITHRKQIEKEKEKLFSQLQKGYNEIQVLRGILPICHSCKKVQKDSEHWDQIEAYVLKHPEAQFSRCVCQKCLKKNFPGMDIFEA
ncbi:MAG: PAS domain S-box protein [Pseudomonadota bacterium]